MKLAALVLAAGAGSRFGGDKLSALFRGEPLIDHAVRAARASPVDRVVVVAARDLAVPDGVEVLRIDSRELSETLKVGIAAVGSVDGLFVFLGDMPLVPHGIAHELAASIGSSYAAQPRWQGQPGHPVLLSARAIADARNLRGDEGAGKLLRASTDVALINCPDKGVTIDVDKTEDLARLG